MKKKIVLEYPLNSSPKVLYPRLSTPGGLAEWFADDVNLKGNIYFFIWEGTEQRAELVHRKENKYIRFKWIDDPEEPVFEFRINVDELTGDVALVISDTIDEDDEDDAVSLWDSQISELKHVLGS
ncbi:MAG: SRPBCC domain-containing protein [Bacteroidales bacterium]|nr:SRPBCC domain-containing protein [Bacteroidales bacterium]